jgi:DNA-binding response OmpR family regulator
MRSPQLVVCETDRWIAELLHATAAMWKWSLRELRQPDACVRALRRGGPGVMVLELSRHPDDGLALLERVAWLCPDTPVVVVSGAADDELTGLAWDLGADYVVAPPQPREAVLPVVVGLMETARNEAPTDP